MHRKIKLLTPLTIILLLVATLTFTLYKPAQSDKPEPIPKLWGYVTYDKGCSFTNHDTVWVQYGANKEYTLVYQSGSDYKYEFYPPSGPAGDRTLWGDQGPDYCYTGVYEFYWGLEDTRQDIEFDCQY